MDMEFALMLSLIFFVTVGVILYLTRKASGSFEKLTPWKRFWLTGVIILLVLFHLFLGVSFMSLWMSTL